jgi:phosphoglycolate phosphatase-like HAD superfamily hydrolase
VVRLILFDIDGTLIRTGGVGVNAFAQTLAAEFKVPNGTEMMRFGGRTDSSLVRELFHHCQIEYHPRNVQRFFDAYVFWLDHLLSQTDRGGACPGVWRFLNGLRALPTPPVIGLLTGNIRLGAEIKLRRYGLWDRFAMGAFGDDHEDRNQIAAVARQRGSRLVGHELAGHEIVVVGDTPHDIRCGRAIQAKILAVTTGGATRAELETHRPDWLVDSLEEVAAEAVCGRPLGTMPCR